MTVEVMANHVRNFSIATTEAAEEDETITVEIAEVVEALRKKGTKKNSEAYNLKG